MAVCRVIPSSLHFTFLYFLQHWIRQRWPHSDIRTRVQQQRTGQYADTTLVGDKTKTPQKVLYEIFDQESYTLSLHAYDILHAPEEHDHMSASATKVLDGKQDLDLLRDHHATAHERKEGVIEALGLQTKDPRCAREIVWSIEKNIKFIIGRCGHDWNQCFGYLCQLSKTLGGFFRLHRTKIVTQQLIGTRSKEKPDTETHNKKSEMTMDVPKIIDFVPAYANECKHFLTRLLYALMDVFDVKKRSNAGQFYLTKTLTRIVSAF